MPPRTNTQTDTSQTRVITIHFSWSSTHAKCNEWSSVVNSSHAAQRQSRMSRMSLPCYRASYKHSFVPSAIYETSPNAGQRLPDKQRSLIVCLNISLIIVLLPHDAYATPVHSAVSGICPSFTKVSAGIVLKQLNRSSYGWLVGSSLFSRPIQLIFGTDAILGVSCYT